MKKTAQPITSRQECDREDEGNLTEARDLTSHVFLKALEALQNYEHKGHFTAWLFAIARYKTMDYFRQAHHEHPLEAVVDLPTEQDPQSETIDWEEIRLIQSARQGDLEAFNCLVLAYQDLIFQQVYWMLGKPEAAEEIAQKTFLLAYQELNSLQNGDFCCWLLKIASRLCLEELSRREHNHKTSGETWSIDREEASDGILLHLLTGLREGNLCQEDLAKLLQEGMDELSPDLRSVVTLVDIHEMDYDQSAEILCIPPETVKSRLARARVQIRDRLFLSVLNSRL